MAARVYVKRTLPGPASMPILGWRGNALAFGRDPISTLQAAYRDYGPISTLADHGPPVVFVLGPDATAGLLVTPQLRYPLLALAQDVAYHMRDQQHTDWQRGRADE